MALGYQLGVSAFFIASNRPQDGELHFLSPRERAERAEAELFSSDGSQGPKLGGLAFNLEGCASLNSLIKEHIFPQKVT